MKPLALLVLLSALASLTVMEVVDDFGQTCPQFFLPNPNNQNERIIPTVLTGDNYKQICQIYKNVYRFATLYDTEKKIPVYSAYTFYKKGKKCKRNNEWFIEPQLEDQNSRNAMKFIESYEANCYTHQAVKTDYINRGYTKGHVYPCGYTSNEEQFYSTFTLTNIAPQTKTNNEKWATDAEQPMLSMIQQNCALSVETPAYIVTGVVPGERWIEIQRGTKPYPEGVNIPSHCWSAFCCTNAGGTRVSRAYIAQQNEEKNPADNMTVNDLNNRLSTLYSTTNYSVFGNEC